MRHQKYAASIVAGALAGALASMLLPGSAAGPFSGVASVGAQAICWPSKLPQGALAPAIPSWCVNLTTGQNTSVSGTNTWLDEFNHGLSNAEFTGSAYALFEKEGASILKAKHFLHADHWMVDVAGHAQGSTPPWNFGGAMMRPNRSFRFEDAPGVTGGKRLVVEVDVAAGIEEYGGNAWPEITVTTAARPTPASSRDDTYAYDYFSKDWTVGCRLQSTRVPICAMYDTTGRKAAGGGRTFEISTFQHEGARAVFGGDPGNSGSDRDRAWRVCHNVDPDTNCRDRFRWELTKDTLTLYVNGIKYMEHAGLPAEKQLPDALLNGDVYVYFSDWVYKPDADTVRFHWDRIAVNPPTGPSAAPGFGQPLTPAQQAVHASHAGAPAAAASAPATPAMTVPMATLGASTSPAPDANTVTFDDQPGIDQPLDGQAPAGLIDWGTGEWYLSGPWKALTSKSVSFTGNGATQGTMRFVAPQRLISLQAYNGGDAGTQLTLSCAGQPDVTVSIESGQQATVPTSWEQSCSAVTISSTNGWDTNFDNLVLG